MLEYPSILGWRRTPEVMGESCYAFEKYDGSNLRWEWTPKQGWFKYGTRHCLFNEATELYGGAVEPFKREIGPGVVERVCTLLKRKPERITVFTEYFGPSSFSGSHILGEAMQLRLFDVSVFKRGFISPREFHDLFGGLEWAAELIYQGPLTQEFIDQVREGTLPVNEGVVCKGGSGHELWRTKVKTKAYMEHLRLNFPYLYAEDASQQ